MAKKRQNDVVIWQDRIEKSAKLRDKKKKEAKLYIDYYKSNQWSAINTSLKEKPVTNLIFAHVKTQLPYLYFQNPKWFVSPAGRKKRDFAKNAELAQLYLNYYARENLRISLKRQMRFAILDAYFWFGAMKTGYVADFAISNLYIKKNVAKEDGSEASVYVNDQGEVIDKPEILTNEKFVSRRRSPASFLFDKEAESCFEDGRFIIEELNLSLSDVKDDKRYSNTSGLKPTYEIASSLKTVDKEDRIDSSRMMEDELARIVMYEIYDIENDEIICMPKDGDVVCRKDSMPKGIDGHPYSFLVFNDIPDEMYPLPEARVLKSPQDSYNKATGIIEEHAKKYARKYGYIEGMIEDDEMDKIKNGEDGTFFKVKELPLAKVVEALQDPTLDPATDKMLAGALFNFRESGGSSEQDRGNVERRKTAYEASKMTEAGSVRKQDRRSLVEDMAADVGTKLLQSMQANMTIEDVVNIGKEGDEGDWVTIDKAKIAGQMNVTVEIGSMTPKLPELERQDFGYVLQALSQFPPELVQTHVNFSALLKAIPQMFPSLENVEFINDNETITANEKKMAQQKQVEQLLQLAQMRGGRIEGMPPQGGQQ